MPADTLLSPEVSVPREPCFIIAGAFGAHKKDGRADALNLSV